MLFRSPDGVELDDLVSAGTFGLMDAIDAFDMSRGVKFETYCVPRIRGAMLDELRTMDWVPRLVRSKASKLNEAVKTLEAKLGRAPADAEVAEHMQLSREEFEKLLVEANAASLEETTAAVAQMDTRSRSTAQAAQDQCNIAATEILSAIQKTGITAADIQTSRLSLSPLYGQRGADSNQPMRITAYQASNVVAVHVSDLAKIGPVIDAGLKAGSNEVQGVSFGLRNDTGPKQQALKLAVEDARRKAQAIAEAAQLQLVGPIEISENGVSLSQPGDYGRPMLMEARAAMPTPVSAGEIEVHAAVTIRYRVNGGR